MRIDIMTLFPDTLNAVLHESILGRAAKKGIIEINCVQIRDFTENKQGQVDDYPYGGGWGCVMMAQPLKSCLDSVMSTAQGLRSRVIFLSPQGERYTQQTAKRLRDDYDHLVLVCGHYEGVDERFIEQCVDEELSLGDFVLTGGEIAAMAVADSVCRLVPGVLSDEQCYTGESHWDGLLEYPQYTRPETWEGRAVPEQLLTGDHARVEQWRRKQQLIRTRERRPDMFERLDLSGKTDRRLLEEIERDASCIRLTEPLSLRRTEQADIAAVLAAAADKGCAAAAVTAGECFTALHGAEAAGLFILSAEPEESYAAISDGKWSGEGDYLVLRLLTAAKAYRGSGIEEYMLRCAEERAATLGRRCLRADVSKKDKARLELFRGCGYRYRGNLLTDGSPRQAYEKILKLK